MAEASNTTKINGTFITNGDLNNTNVMRQVEKISVDPEFSHKSLAIHPSDDDAELRAKYRPFLLDERTTQQDWISRLELSTVTKMAQHDLSSTGQRLQILVLYGSLRQCSYSKLLAYETARILFRLGCDVRVYNPESLPVKDDNPPLTCQSPGTT